MYEDIKKGMVPDDEPFIGEALDKQEVVRQEFIKVRDKYDRAKKACVTAALSFIRLLMNRNLKNWCASSDDFDDEPSQVYLKIKKCGWFVHIKTCSDTHSQLVITTKDDETVETIPLTHEAFRSKQVCLAEVDTLAAEYSKKEAAREDEKKKSSDQAEWREYLRLKEKFGGK